MLVTICGGSDGVCMWTADSLVSWLASNREIWPGYKKNFNSGYNSLQKTLRHAGKRNWFQTKSGNCQQRMQVALPEAQ